MVLSEPGRMRAGVTHIKCASPEDAMAALFISQHEFISSKPTLLTFDSLKIRSDSSWPVNFIDVEGGLLIV